MIRVSCARVLNEASEYGSCFSRAVSFPVRGRMVVVSGTASVGSSGETLHVGDFSAQCWRTFENIAALLAEAGASWKNVFKTFCYLRDIERDYEEFNRVRREFYRSAGVDPFPASTGVQAILCRPDLLVEVEAWAIVEDSE